jgi:hypothetical protein
MSVTSSLIGTYLFDHLSGNPDFDAIVICINEQGNPIATLNFLKDGHTVPPNIATVEPRVFFPASRFNDVITTLRYEKPIRFIFDTNSLQARIEIGVEPVGEQEG